MNRDATFSKQEQLQFGKSVFWHKLFFGGLISLDLGWPQVNFLSKISVYGRFIFCRFYGVPKWNWSCLGNLCKITHTAQIFYYRFSRKGIFLEKSTIFTLFFCRSLKSETRNWRETFQAPRMQCSREGVQVSEDSVLHMDATEYDFSRRYLTRDKSTVQWEDSQLLREFWQALITWRSTLVSRWTRRRVQRSKDARVLLRQQQAEGQVPQG